MYFLKFIKKLKINNIAKNINFLHLFISLKGHIVKFR